MAFGGSRGLSRGGPLGRTEQVRWADGPGRRTVPEHAPTSADLRRTPSTLAIGSLGAGTANTPPLPDRMADTGGGSQLITAEAPDTGSTTGTVTWWEQRGGRWAEAGSAPARFGANGLAEGATREQGTSTTPTGLYDLPYAFGIEEAPAGTRYAYRKVNEDSWWCQDNASASYNRWVEPRPADWPGRTRPSTWSPTGRSTPARW
ncbi:L,D-transpeptidase catalytic domain-containing protein OS=Streptomyces microflavus OX=1919 GN=Smic_12000 PE=4 SV=1 [Streptomyces microflavus]